MTTRIESITKLPSILFPSYISVIRDYDGRGNMLVTGGEGPSKRLLPPGTVIQWQEQR